MSNTSGTGRERGASGGGDGDRGGGSARVTIPGTVRKTIQTIREITGRQHTNEDIYSVLKDCSMDPNETAQKLLYLDTFHEVKSKRGRRKEMSGTQGRGARGSKGNHSANHMYHDAAGWRNAASRRENGVNHMKDKGPSNNLPVVQNLNSDTANAINKTKAPVTSNGSLCLPNGNSSPECDLDSPKDESVIIEDGLLVDRKKPDKVLAHLVVSPSPPYQTSESVIQDLQGNSSLGMNHLATPTISESASGMYSCASDPVLSPPIIRHPGTVHPIKQEGNTQQSASGHSLTQRNKHVSTDVGKGTPEIENISSTITHPVIQKKALPKPKAVEEDELFRDLQPLSSSADDSSLAASTTSGDNHSSQELVNPITVISLEDTQAEDSSSMSLEKTVPNGHVIFPNHLKIPEALKSRLSFGSFDTKIALESSENDNGCGTNIPDAELSCLTNETVGESSLSNQSISSTVQMDHPDLAESPQLSDESHNSDVHVSPTVEPKSDKSVPEMMSLSEGKQNPAVHGAPNYGFGIMPHMQGGHIVQFAGHETQNENPRASSSPSPSLSPTPLQNSIAASPQPLLFRPPFPPNYFTYGHYFNPYFLPPMHQFVSHNGLSQQPSAGNPYITQAAPVPGMKFPLPQFKPGTSTGNSTPAGIQAIHGSYGSSAVGFNPGPAATPGSTAGYEDLSASQLKESQIYTTGPLNDVAAWITPSGQDVSSLHLNPLYHLTPQGQHLAFSHVQPGPSPFPGIYPPVQAIPAPSTINPVLQQSQALSATPETVSPPPGAYQQTQLAQINWNTGF